MASPLKKLAELPWTDRMLLARAWGTLFLVRLALSVTPWPVVRRLILGRPPRPRSQPSAPHAERIIWAIGIARRLVPRATCLVQAAAARVLLVRAGHDPHLRLGVTKSTAGDFEAHAWLELGGRVVVGRLRHFERFAPLGP